MKHLHLLLLPVIMFTLCNPLVAQVERIADKKWRQKVEHDTWIEGTYNQDFNAGFRIISYYQPIPFPDGESQKLMYTRFFAPEQDLPYFFVSLEKIVDKYYRVETKRNMRSKGQWNALSGWSRKGAMGYRGVSPKELSYLTQYLKEGDPYFLPTQISFAPELKGFGRNLYVIDLKLEARTKNGQYLLHKGIHKGIRPETPPTLQGAIRAGGTGSVVSFHLDRTKMGMKSGWYTLYVAMPKYNDTHVYFHKVFIYHKP